MDAFQIYPQYCVVISNADHLLQRERRRKRRRRRKQSLSLQKSTDVSCSRLFLLAATACCWRNPSTINVSLTYQVSALQIHSPSVAPRPDFASFIRNHYVHRIHSTLTPTKLYSIQGQESIHVNAGFNQSPRQISIPSSGSGNTNKNDQVNAPAPVYITIGPPCAGKTTALAACLERDGYDPAKVLSSKEVALDEQSDVYVRVPLTAFLFPQTRLDEPTGNTIMDDNKNSTKLGDLILKSTGTTLRDRLLDPPTTELANTDTELRNVILRVAGRATPQEFANRTRAQALAAGDTVKFFKKRRIEVAEDLIDGVEQVSARAVGELLFQLLGEQKQQEQQSKVADLEHEQDLPYDNYDSSSKNSEDSSDTDEEVAVDLSTINATPAHLLSAKALIKTPYVDLFVPQTLFTGGLDKAEQNLQELLKGTPMSTPVAWSNTNTRPVEYAAALAAAQRAGRPVKFVAWGTFDFPRLPRSELLRRTVSKFRNTGRYVPAGAVAASLGRVERLIQDAEKEAQKLATISANEKGSEERVGDDDTSIVDNEKLEIHRMNVAFAALAGYLMYDDGHVMKISEPRKLHQKSSKHSFKHREQTQ